ncbi:diguanylate cyclase [Magnetovibrio sp. PR-2]|uniref:diguanylate cyclase n=1 Tax=Magnetovibrio sp. PR-2 TaxID=3120356 RepID=UPI002FCE1EEF
MDSTKRVEAAGRPAVVLPETVIAGIGSVERAIAEQTEWFKNWHEQVVVNHDTSGFRIEAIGDFPLGAWYLGPESQAFRNNPDYLTLGQKLADVLEQVQAFLRGTENGEPHPIDDYSRFTHALLELNMLVQHMQNDAWRGLTKMDPLTGVRNRHEMMVELDAERERARRTNLPSTICMVDLDHFKTINDTYGHVVGDVVLRHLSGLLVEQLRPYDMVFRYGGEEFLLCLPNTELDTAMHVLERLRATIEREVVMAGEGNDQAELHVTASFGVAVINVKEHIVDTIERADMALYDIKKNGRNAVKAWMPAED